MAATASRLLRGFSIAGLACLLLGVLVIASGLLLPGLINHKLQAGVLENILWTPRSAPLVDARYRNNTAPGSPPDYFKVWFFNISNLDDVRQGAKPVLEQVGPYVHRAYHEKHEVMWNAEGRVYFKDYTYFKYEPSLSAADPEAPIATFNLALLGVLAALHGNMSPRLVPFADVLMQAIASYQGDPDMHGLFTVKPALSLLWGYQDKLLSWLEKLLPRGTLPNGAIVALMQNTSSLEAALARNASIFNTGELNISQTWNMESDRGHRVVTSWPCPESVRGSDATQFRPGLTASDRLTVFVGDIFQSADLVVNSSTELHGVKLLRYWLDPAQAAPNPCHNMELQGLMNITGPQAAGWNGPSNASGPYVFVSMPMFCGADERLAQEVEGLQCDWQKHMTWVDVEPTTGITLRAYKRMMMSSRVGELGSILDPHVPGNLTIPMFWAEEHGEATPEMAQQFKATLYRAQWLVANLAKVCGIAGGCLLLLGVVLAVLTVELAADPDKWPGMLGGESALAAARGMLSVGGDEGTAAGGGAARAPFGAAGGGAVVVVNEADLERQGLLQEGDGGPGEIDA